MSKFQQKIKRHDKMTPPRKKKPQYEETNQASVPDSDMADIFEFLYGKFKITMIYMLIILMEKVDNVNRYKETLRKKMDKLK